MINKQAIADQLLAHERAINDRWNIGEFQVFTDNYTDDVSFIDPILDKICYSKAELVARFNAYFPYKTFPVVRSVMSNEKVVVSDHGDMAVVTYNLQNDVQGKSGQILPLPLWNAVEVYQQINGEWRIIHSSWSFAAQEEIIKKLENLFTQLAK